MTWYQLFLANIPEECWGERNDKCNEFKSMKDANIKITMDTVATSQLLQVTVWSYCMINRQSRLFSADFGIIVHVTVKIEHYSDCYYDYILVLLLLLFYFLLHDSSSLLLNSSNIIGKY